MNKIIKKISKHYLLTIGLSIIFFLFLIAIFGPLFISKQGITPDLSKHLLPPDKNHPFGFGVNGISVLAWLIYGSRMSFLVSIIVCSISLSIGTSIGAIAGYWGGKTDALLMRIIDIILAFPGLLLALYLASVMRPSIFTLIFALSCTGWVSYARLVRALVYEIKNRDFITASKALGASDLRIIFRHILPNITGPLLIQVSYSLSVIILAESGLTFLGLGLPIGTPSFGALLDQGVSNLFSASYLAVFPSICIALSVLGFNFIGDGLRDILDPKAKIF